MRLRPHQTLYDRLPRGRARCINQARQPPQNLSSCFSSMTLAMLNFLVSLFHYETLLGSEVFVTSFRASVVEIIGEGW